MATPVSTLERWLANRDAASLHQYPRDGVRNGPNLGQLSLQQLPLFLRPALMDSITPTMNASYSMFVDQLENVIRGYFTATEQQPTETTSTQRRHKPVKTIYTNTQNPSPTSVFVLRHPHEVPGSSLSYTTEVSVVDNYGTPTEQTQTYTIFDDSSGTSCLEFSSQVDQSRSIGGKLPKPSDRFKEMVSQTKGQISQPQLTAFLHIPSDPGEYRRILAPSQNLSSS